MAITKIHAIKSTLGKALAYIENPDKTDGQMLVSGYNCEPQTASIDFEMTTVLAHKARNLKRKMICTAPPSNEALLAPPLFQMKRHIRLFVRFFCLCHIFLDTISNSRIYSYFSF